MEELVMYLTLKNCVLVGKEKRKSQELSLERDYDFEFSFIEERNEIICYFKYTAEKVDGEAVAVAITNESFIPYSDLTIGDNYFIEISNSYINIIVNLDKCSNFDINSRITRNFRLLEKMAELPPEFEKEGGES